MMSQNDYQGKKPNQIKDSETFVFWSMVGIVVIILILTLL